VSGEFQIDERLRRQREQLAPLLEISPTAIVITDLDANVVAWNPGAERLFGYTAGEALGRNLDDLVATTEELHQAAVSYSERAVRKDHVQAVTRRTRKDGTLVDVELHGAPVLVDGEPVGSFGIYHDITDLNRQRRFLESLLEVSPEAIVTTDMDDTVRSWNPAAERLFGYTAEEAVGQNIDDLVANREDLREEAEALDWEANEGRQVQAVTQRTRRDGSLVDIDVVGGPVTVGDELVAKHVIYHDITELQQQKRYFQSLLEISPTAIVLTDLESKVESWNPAAETLFGYPAEEAVGRLLDDLVATRPDLHEEALGYSRAAAAGERVEAYSQRTRKDGSLVDVLMVSAPVVVGEERIGFNVTYLDVSELQRQKRWNESVLELSPTAIVTVDRENRCTSWNPAAEQLFGYSAQEAMGRNLDDLVAASEGIREESDRLTREGLTGKKTQAVGRRTRKDGTLVEVDMRGAPVFVSGELVGESIIYHDIGEIQRQKKYYETLVQSSPVAIALLDPEGTVHSWNPAAERLFGYAAEEAVGQNIDDLVATSDEVRAEAVSQSQAGIAGGFVHSITRRTHKDGSFVDVEIFGAPVIVDGQPSGLYAMYHDISELQRARRDAEAATQAKSAFLATMSHEIRTPLNAVIGMTGLLLDTPLGPEQRNYAEVIRGSGDALLGVINDILDFSKIEAGRLDLERVPFDLRECLESALELVAAGALRKGLDLAYDMEPGVPAAVVGDATRLRQITINLLNNAVKFTERGEVVVTVDAERLDIDHGDRHRLHFSVRDTGIGIPAGRMDRLFESFSQVDPSTTRRYGGTGLGLAISKRLAEMMDGTMWAESQVGQGSTFHFTIEAEASDAVVRAYERGQAPQLEGRRVLIVDDNATNRQILSRQTQSWGMLARATESPAEALEWIRRGDPFDVAILDMQMPDMDGLALAREIRGHRDAEALPLVMLTSLGRTDQTPSEVEFAAFLTKPIKPSQLYEALLEVFGTVTEQEPVVEAGPDEVLAERRPLRILVVEDNTVNQQLAVLLLRKLGYRADVAANGVEALDALERQPYDVVLMDVEMPEMDGLEATRRIHRRWPRERRPHIIAVTANALAGEREICLQAGMDDYIPKPIRMEELTGALGRAVPRGVGGDGTPALDPKAISRLVSSFGDRGAETVSGLIDTFTGHAPEEIAELRGAVERDDVEGTRRAAHTLKSNAATFGATVLAGLCRDLEALAGRGTLEGAPELAGRIERELRRATAALERVRGEL
jgi:PAS domain S-box-containing protein